MAHHDNLGYCFFLAEHNGPSGNKHPVSMTFSVLIFDLN